MPTETPLRRGTRARILTAAAELFRRQGYAGTGMKAIAAASDAPFGSLYHFFPGGKEELGVAVIEAGGRTYQELVETFIEPGAEVVDAVIAFFDGAAAVVESTDYVDACPIATIALEVASTSESMRAASASAFESWLDVLTDRFRAAGIKKRRARELAVECFCAIEGAFLLSRTTRSVAPLRIAGRGVAESIRAALSEPDPVLVT